MSDLLRFVLDRDHLVSEDAVDVRIIAARTAELTSKKLFWNPDRPDLWFTDLAIDNFHEMQDQLSSMGLPVDLFHHIDEMFRIPQATGRFTQRLLGLRSVSPIVSITNDLEFDMLSRECTLSPRRVPGFRVHPRCGLELRRPGTLALDVR